jgi:hypothetical protein
MLTGLQAFGGLFIDQQAAADIALDKRRVFLDILKEAALIPRTPRAAALGPLDEYIIDEPNPNVQNDISLGSKFTFHRWLRRVRKHDKYFPTFYFPSNFAGPDLVFVSGIDKKTRGGYSALFK